MRKYLAAALILFLIGVSCVGYGRAQLMTLTGAGKGATGVAPTVLHLTSPNDFSNAAWTAINVGIVSTTQLAPDGSNTASQLICADVVNCFIAQTLGVTLTTGVVYSITGYIKSVVIPVWADVLINDNSSFADYVVGWVNASTSATGTTTIVGGGVVDSWATTPDANGYTKAVITFHFTSTPVSSNTFIIGFANADGGSTPTVGQTFDVWGWGQ